MSNIESALLQLAKEYEKAEACDNDACMERQEALEAQCVALVKAENIDLIDFFSRCDMTVFRVCSCFFGDLTADNAVLEALIPVVESRYKAAARATKDRKTKNLLAVERDNAIEDIILTLNKREAEGF